jgi:hypothetical protein
MNAQRVAVLGAGLALDGGHAEVVRLAQVPVPQA